MNKKYDPVIDLASFQKWKDQFNRGVQDVVDSGASEQLGKNVGEAVTRSLDAIFNQAASGSYREEASASSSAQEIHGDLARNAGSWKPRANCLQTADAYIFEIELAGIDENAIDVEIRGVSNGNALCISGTSSQQKSSERAEFNNTEMPEGVFYREFELPADSNCNDVTATNKNGLLGVRVGRKTLSSSETIKVSIKPS